MTGYTGRDRDEETGLNYYRSRYFDAAVGKFISTDPIEFAAGDANLFRYVGNTATSYVDPFGLFTVGWHDKITRKGLGNAGLSRAAMNRIVVANQMVDLNGVATNSGTFAEPENHGSDNEIKGTIERIMERIVNLKNMKCDHPDKMLDEIGKILHAVQDLYAHTNYVELMDSKNNRATPLGELPVWQLWSQHGDATGPAAIKSGPYIWIVDELQSGAPRPGTGTAEWHYWTNKDTPKSERGRIPNKAGVTNFQHARDLAERHTEFIWKVLEGQLSPQQLNCIRNYSGPVDSLRGVNRPKGWERQ